MVNIPASFTDYTTAIMTILQSQTDVSQLLANWSNLVYDRVPKMVTITTSSGAKYEVPNLAMVRQELIANASNANPNISSTRVRFTQGSPATGRYSNAVYDSLTSSGVTNVLDTLWDSLDSDSMTEFGWSRTPTNDIFTLLPLPDSDKNNPLVVKFKYLPRLQIVGYDTDKTSSHIKVAPIDANDSSFMVSDAQTQYATIVRFVNHSSMDYTLYLYSSQNSSNAESVITIPGRSNYDSYVDVMFWCAKGQDLVNIRRLGNE